VVLRVAGLKNIVEAVFFYCNFTSFCYYIQDIQNMNSTYLSIIVPVYNESSRKWNELKSNFEKIGQYFGNKNIEYEVIVVNDGSTDDSAKRIKQFSNIVKNLKIIDRKENKGKWFSIREGFSEASGRYRLFTDADGSTSIENFDKFWNLLDGYHHIVIGSRDMLDSRIEVHQPKWKEVLGNLGSGLTRVVIGLPKIKDTQCGFKLLSEEASIRIIPKLTIDRWGGDFELLALSEKFGYKVVEVPVVWVDTGNSLVDLKGYLSTLYDLMKVKLRLSLKSYNLE
jgi:dolichyl-phosphate beta-glucosyltransferase